MWKCVWLCTNKNTNKQQSLNRSKQIVYVENFISEWIKKINCTHAIRRKTRMERELFWILLHDYLVLNMCVFHRLIFWHCLPNQTTLAAEDRSAAPPTRSATVRPARWAPRVGRPSMRRSPIRQPVSTVTVCHSSKKRNTNTNINTTIIITMNNHKSTPTEAPSKYGGGGKHDKLYTFRTWVRRTRATHYAIDFILRMHEYPSNFRFGHTHSYDKVVSAWILLYYLYNIDYF